MFASHGDSHHPASSATCPSSMEGHCLRLGKPLQDTASVSARYLHSLCSTFV